MTISDLRLKFIGKMLVCVHATVSRFERIEYSECALLDFGCFSLSFILCYRVVVLESTQWIEFGYLRTYLYCKFDGFL